MKQANEASQRPQKAIICEQYTEQHFDQYIKQTPSKSKKPLKNKKELIKQLADYYSGAFDPRLGEIYIPPLTSDRERASAESCLPLADKVNEFLDSSKRSLLLLGQAGMGKSYFSLLTCQTVWRRIREQLKTNPNAPLPRLPLYIYLPNYDKQLHREKQLVDKGKLDKGTLLETVLRKHQLSDEEIEIVKTKPLLIFLDGFDEITFRENIYRLQGWGEHGYDIQVVVTCRPDVLLHENLSALFEAGGEFSGQLATYTRQYLQPFTDEQIQAYFKACFKTKSDSERYYHQLTQLPSLKALVTTPFLLRMVTDILPYIDKLPKASAANIPRFTQSSIFHYFLEGVPNDKGEPCGGWFVKEIARGRAKNLLSSSCPKLCQKDVIRYMRGYAENLALFLLDDETGQLNERSLTAEETLQPNLIELLHKRHPRTLFFDTDGTPNTNFRDIRSSCLLHLLYGRVDEDDYLEEGEFKFLHKSVTEYLVAHRVMVEELSLIQASKNGVDPSPPRRGLNRMLLVKEPEIITRLAEMARENPDFKRRLIDVLMASRHTPSLGRVASNAITILNVAWVSFYGWKLEGVCIAGADLTGAICDKANFSGANLMDVTFYRASLREVNFKGAQMSGIQFGEYPYLKFESVCYAVAYSSNESYLAVASGKAIHLFDATTRTLRRILRGHESYVTSVEFSDDGKYVVSGSGDKTVCVWDVERGELRQRLTGHEGDVNSVGFNDNGKHVVSGSSDTTVSVWDVECGELCQCLRGHEGDVYGVAFSSDGKYVVSGSGDKTVCVWDVERGELRHRLRDHESWVSSVRFSDDGKHVVSGGGDKAVSVWDIGSGKLRQCLRGHKGDVYSVAFSGDGKLVVSGSSDKTVSVWDVGSGELCQCLRGHEGDVYSVAFSDDGKRVVSGSWDKTVCVWDIASGELRQRLRGHEDNVYSVAFSDDGKCVVSGSWDNTVCIWEVDSGELCQRLTGHENRVYSVAFSGDGKLVVSGSHDKTVSVWDVGSGELCQRLRSHEDIVRSVGFSVCFPQKCVHSVF